MADKSAYMSAGGYGSGYMGSNASSSGYAREDYASGGSGGGANNNNQGGSGGAANPGQQPNYKTQLCKNYGRLGCGHCRYGPKRQFIHPEDPAYLDMYPDTWHFAKEQEAHSQYVQALHTTTEHGKLGHSWNTYFRGKMTAVRLSQTSEDSVLINIIAYYVGRQQGLVSGGPRTKTTVI
ncbi:hypothetical protein L3Y34_018983 [Caenorhabditis briggsae]|uniref:C3H1-type domain-containing protein n=1 Tax=Caenorhabditis briggsae TaxID=6238 RepID=A0AAE9IVE5_CAEBR|nr:hypothetical protein L3Y34_018983 [Caenorhabditis briggsae]